jgi:DNA repair protein RadC
MHEVISDMPRDDQPRERMLRHGAQTLSNSELLAILLGSGMHGKNAMQLARELMAGEGLRALSGRDINQVIKVAGMGAAKATRVFACFELATRLGDETWEEPPDYEPVSFGRELVNKYAGATQEHLGAAFLNSRLRVLGHREVYIGTIEHAAISTRDIIKYALEGPCVNIILYHNHPSGDPTPSEDDVKFTREMKEALGHIDLKLVDHLIIGKHRYLSMKERDMMG